MRVAMLSLYRMTSLNLTTLMSTVDYHLLTLGEAEVHRNEAWQPSSFNDFVSPLTSTTLVSYLERDVVYLQWIAHQKRFFGGQG